ncbi:ribosome 60S biogenesis N-terminal-domain-containing protein [Xylariomycetidae sp. FL2044]|nr:ribosome 60S biogenesis N-terminal-domain-containing protein [Xylariomycetidae sp. FL2044]
MVKRKTYGGDGQYGGKKQKTTHVHEPPTSEEVYTARQLGQLLTFQQDLRQARHGLQSLKNLLDSIVNEDDKKSEHLEIVWEYLQSIRPRDDEEDDVPVYLSDIMETWSMASQMNNENVMSAVAVVLALLLKIISGNVDWASYGLSICRTLLQKRQQELIAKNLSADKGKDFIISPTLRLLREAISMDGGALAAPIFRARNNTFKHLARNIGLRYLGDGLEDPKRPSVRTNAIRFLLSSLRLLHVEAKRDILLQKDIVASLVRHLRDDPPHLIHEILDTLKASIVLDKKLARDAKIRILNSHSLTQISSLYGYSRDSGESVETSQYNRSSVEDAAHEFLLAACTDTNAGIRRSEHGFYPEGIDPDTLPLGTHSAYSMDFGMDNIPWMNKFIDDVPVRNSVLAEFSLSLRPWSNTKQSELLLAIFKSAPELIAHYFCRKKSFTFEPKLTATWMGYAALLYNVIELPIPPHFGHPDSYAAIPPPTSVILGSLIPLPMTPKTMAKCLTNKSKLVSFYAIRMLVLAIQKLGQALDMHRQASALPGSIWEEAARRLVDDFYQRIPDIKDVITCYRSMGDSDLLQKQAASRLLLLYYEVIPQMALRAKFDVSPMVLAAIKLIEGSQAEGQDAAMSLMELENLCTIAQYSPSMRWFVRASDMPTSPFTTLLRLYMEKSIGLSTERLIKVLRSVADENQLVESRPGSPGLDPLLAALKASGEVIPDIWAFLDNCFERCARTPIKFLESIEEQLAKVKPKKKHGTIVCPLLMTMAEQISFFVSSSSNEKILKKLARLLSDILGYSAAAGVNKPLLEVVRELFMNGIGNKKLAAKITIPDRPMPTSDELSVSHPHPSLTASNPSDAEVMGDDDPKFPSIDGDELKERLSVPIISSKDNALIRWSSKTAEELVEEGFAASLIGLLSSEHPSIRKEALTNVIKMAAKIKESSYEENEQVWLLLMELAETAREPVIDGPLPSVIIAFSCRALDILKNPLHCLYEKLNLFLTSGPTWALDKIPLMQHILQDGPSQDGAYYSEISWLLGFLLDSLRNTEDVALFHRRKVFERIQALSGNPFMGPNLRTQVLRILYRTSCIEGGSNTAITRFGAVNWLAAQKAAASDDAEVALYQAMMERLWETCDQQRISAWSKGGVEKVVR